MNYLLDLHLFGEGAAAAAGGEAGATGEAAQAQTPGSTRRGKSGALSNVLYGIQQEAVEEAPAAGEQPEVKTTSNTLEDKRKTFREMITGEYKDLYTEEFQNAFNRRFPEYKSLQDQVKNAQPILDKLAARYNVLDGDLSKLEKAIDDDHTYWAAAAEDAGMDENAYRDLQLMRQQNANLLRQQRDFQARQQADLQVQQWYQESEAVKAKFPKFDFNTELQNPEFVRLIQHNTPIEHAYKMLHFDELMNDAVAGTVTATQKAVTENIRAKGSRPAENGSSSQSTFTVKRSASQLNKADRAEIARRVARGEQIAF